MTRHNVQTVDVHHLKNKMEIQSDLCLIDVRELDEWHTGHIPSALHIPKDVITSHITSQVKNKTHPIYLYCRGGVRSLYAAQCLMDIGYEEVYSVDGGIMEWVMYGFPIHKQQIAQMHTVEAL